MLLWLAIAVSYLFSALPFGNDRVGFMPTIPGPTLEEAAPAHWAPALHSLSDALSWDGECHVVWATLNDATPQPALWALLGALPLVLAPSDSGVRHAWFQRPPPRFGRQLYRLRAPPHVV